MGLPLFGLVAFSIFWTVTLSLLIFGYLVYLVDTDKFFASFWVLFFTLLLFHISGTLDLTYPFRNPGISIFYAVAYLFFGFFWTGAKWHSYLREWGIKAKKLLPKVQKDYQDMIEGKNNRVSYKQANKDEFIPFEKYVVVSGWGEELSVPQVKDKTKLLVGWALWWPFSLAWSLINDPIRRFYIWVINDVMGKELQRMANRKAKEVGIFVPTGTELVKVEEDV